MLETKVLRKILSVRDLGLCDYAEAWERQRSAVEARGRGGPDLLFLVEHPPVVTMGREHRGPAPDCGLPTFEVERGGRATYHGPGQLVGYPILDLEGLSIGLDTYLRTLEECLAEAVRPWTEARRLRGFTGVWVGRRKLASIGVALRGRVTYHGFALNVNNDLDEFGRIHPCGLEPGTMTSLKERAGAEVDLEAVKSRVASSLAAAFGLEPSFEVLAPAP